MVVNFLNNFWFTIKAKKRPKLTDKKTLAYIRQHNELDERLVQSLIKKKFPTLKQFKYISKILTPTERLLIKSLWVIIISCVAFIGLNFYLNLPQIPADGGQYFEGLVGSPRYINPILAPGNDVDLDIVSLVFNGLLRYDPDKGLIPDLATEYSISEDSKIYTFKLRSDVYWHDGVPFTADDIVFTINLIKNPNTHSPLYFNFKGVTVEKIDKNTVRFILEKPFAPFIESLIVGILPEHIWSSTEATNINLSEFNLKPIGTGPFKFDNFSKDSQTSEIRDYTLVRNENYYNKKAYLKKITFKFYNTFEQAVMALNNKNVFGISYLPKELQDQVLSNYAINYHFLNLPQYTALFFNKKNNPILADKKIRKLLSHAIDKDKIINEILNSQAQKIDGPILPGQLGYTNDYPKYPFDIEYAKKNLNDAGWILSDYQTKPTTDDTPVATYPYQVRKKDKTYLEFELTTVDQTENKKIAESIQKDWLAIGVKLNIKLIKKEDFNQEILKSRNYQILLYTEIIGYDPDPYAFWHSSQIEAPGLNLSMFVDKKTDILLEEARKTNNQEIRKKNYIEFQKIIAEEAPAIFLFNQTYIYPQNKKLKGFNSHTIILPANRFSDVTNWYLKTRRQLLW